MNMFNLSPAEWWGIIGFLCLSIELTTVPNIGFLFLGFGGLTNAILVSSYPGFLDYQYSSFGTLSFLWLLILWLPIKKYVYRKRSQPDHFDMVGGEVEVIAQIMPNNTGSVKWSGTIMNARLIDTETTPAEISEKLYIKEIHGNILICSRTR